MICTEECRGAIEMYLKLLIRNSRAELYNQYEKFRMFEVEYSCRQTYPKEFNTLFEKRVCQDLKIRADYLHFGWVDFIDGYHKAVNKFPYSIYGIITFLKDKSETGIFISHAMRTPMVAYRQQYTHYCTISRFRSCCIMLYEIRFW